MKNGLALIGAITTENFGIISDIGSNNYTGCHNYVPFARLSYR